MCRDRVTVFIRRLKVDLIVTGCHNLVVFISQLEVHRGEGHDFNMELMSSTCTVVDFIVKILT